MPDVQLHPAAEDELHKEAVWYEDRDAGLGRRFQQAFLACVDRILEFPESGSPSSKRTRTRRIRDFPHGVVYRATAKRIEIIAVAHPSRRPDYWSDRVDEDE